MNTLPEVPGLRQAVTNLLDNVCQFTRPVGRMCILLEASAECVELTVEQDRSIDCSGDKRFVVRLPATSRHGSCGVYCNLSMKISIGPLW